MESIRQIDSNTIQVWDHHNLNTILEEILKLVFSPDELHPAIFFSISWSSTSVLRIKITTKYHHWQRMRYSRQRNTHTFSKHCTAGKNNVIKFSKVRAAYVQVVNWHLAEAEVAIKERIKQMEFVIKQNNLRKALDLREGKDSLILKTNGDANYL